jgi:hypothetical protein
MRKLIVSLAAVGAALVVASPAAAQYYPQPQPQPYGYGSQQYGYGYNNGYGQVRALQVRIDAVQRQIERLDRRDWTRGAKQLRKESRNIERRLRSAERYGLNPYEANSIQVQIAQLEQRVRYAAGNRYGGYQNGYGSNGYGNNAYGYSDRDRDQRNDRYEDDRGRDHDD